MNKKKKIFSSIIVTSFSVCLFVASYNDNINIKEKKVETREVTMIKTKKHELQKRITTVEEDVLKEIALQTPQIHQEKELILKEKYSICSLNLRTHVGEDSDIYTTVGANTKLLVVQGFNIGDWVRVMYDDIELYVNNKYLSDEQVNVQEINNEDLMLLAKLINSEVGSLTTEAQIACGSVVMNRVHSNNFPNSIRDVIYQTGQYAVVENGRINLEPSELSFQNAKYILENGSQIPQNVVYQSMSAQGSGIYKVIDGEYYCYE